MICLMKRRNFLFSSAALAVPFAEAAEFGPGEIKLGVATYSFRSFQRDLCIKYVKQLGIEYVDVKEFDIKIAIHNHGPEDKHFPSPKSVLDAVKGMDSRMGLCMDIGHTVRTG